MYDEIQDAHEAIFKRIILGVILISLTAGLAAFLAEGLPSPWFIRALALFLITLMALGLRFFGKVAVASYLLVLEMLGLVVEMFLQAGAFATFSPYLLIPIIMIAGLLFNPLTTLIITGLSILTIMVMMVITGQFTWPHLGILLPAFLLALFSALLSSEFYKHLMKLGSRLRENRTLLKDRTRIIMDSTRSAEAAQQKVAELQQQLAQTQAELMQARQKLSQGDDRFYYLLQGTMRELEKAVKHLGQELGQMDEQGQPFSLEPIWRKIYYLKGLLINLREIVQVEHGEIKLSYQVIDINRLVNEVASTAQGLVRHKPVAVQAGTAADLPLLQADPFWLRQALLQLLNNAVAYTKHGLIQIQAEVVQDELRIFVSDTGPGISADELGQVFEKFGRDGQPSQGAGLGLALTKRLIELHGGRIWASSVLEVGSTFYIALPLKPEPALNGAEQLLTSPAGLPTPVMEAEAIRERGVRPGLSEREPALSQQDLDQTMISAGMPSSSTAAARNSLSTRPSPRAETSQPELAWRFGQGYVRRASFILLGLFVLVMAFITALAVVNGPVEPVAADQSPSPEGSAIVADLSTPSPTATEPAAPAPAATPSPTTGLVAATATTVSIQAATPTPPGPVFTATPTEEPAATPSPTAVLPAKLLLMKGPVLLTIASIGSSQLSFGLDHVDLLPGNIETTIKTGQPSRLSWSPAGQALLTIEQENDRDIYLVKQEDNQPLNLTAAVGDDIQPAWSPDGRQIAFSSGRSGNFEIYLMAADGGSPAPLTDSIGYDEWPVWSPDGRQIAFVSDRDGNTEIYVMDATGGNPRRLTNDPADDWPASWSPDGRRLVFASNRDENWNLYVIPAEGGQATRLTSAPGIEREPVWSPDGQFIAFAYNNGDNWDIYTLPAPGELISEIPSDLWTQITHTPADERYPAWLPEQLTINN